LERGNMKKLSVVEMINISKKFSRVPANDKICFSLNKGEIHALLGENGAGKSTLMNILSGLYRPDYGEIKINGKTVEFNSPKDAIVCGIGMVHQHFELVKAFTVSENIMIGLKNLKQIYNKKYIDNQIVESAQKYGLEVEPDARVRQLTVGEMQKVEIIKVLMQGAEILIMDEPTAVLAKNEIEAFYNTLHLMVGEGKSIIIISHKMREVIKNTDRITILQNGRSIGTFDTKSVEESKISEMMMGKDKICNLVKRTAVKPEKVLELKNVCCSSSEGFVKLKDISFSIHQGEILGIAGIDNNGQRELAEVIAGLIPVQEGNIILKGSSCTGENRKRRIERGIGYVPEDRMTTGLVGNMNLCENAVLESYRSTPGIFMNWKKVREDTEDIVEKFNIKVSSIYDQAGTMSGGNMQKLLLAREIEMNPVVLVLSYPFRGLDIGASQYMKKLLLEERNKGRALLLISEEIDDLLQLSDRIAVLHQGLIVDIVNPMEVTAESIGMMMYEGGKENYSG
jgi:simple sugar transport system ATP-binding protein